MTRLTLMVLLALFSTDLHAQGGAGREGSNRSEAAPDASSKTPAGSTAGNSPLALATIQVKNLSLTLDEATIILSLDPEKIEELKSLFGTTGSAAEGGATNDASAR